MHLTEPCPPAATRPLGAGAVVGPSLWGYTPQVLSPDRPRGGRHDDEDLESRGRSSPPYSGLIVSTALADEIVHFTNGAEMPVRSHTVDKEKDMVKLDLGGNSFIAFPMSMVDKIVSAGQDVFLNPVIPSVQSGASPESAGAASRIRRFAARGSAGYQPQPDVEGHAGTMLGEAADAIPTAIPASRIWTTDGQQPESVQSRVPAEAGRRRPAAGDHAAVEHSRDDRPLTMQQRPVPPDPPVSPPPPAAGAAQRHSRPAIHPPRIRPIHPESVKLVLGVTGPNAAGKGEVADYLRTRGLRRPLPLRHRPRGGRGARASSGARAS